MNVVLSLDIGATKINSALVSARSFRIVERLEKLPSQPRGSSVIPQIRGALETLHALATQARLKPIACGAAIAGQVQWPSGVVRLGPNFHTKKSRLPLKTLLRRWSGLLTVVDNDAHAFTLGESVIGTGRGKHLVAGITLGTGIGGAIAVDGRILRGADNTTGEFGHMTIAEDGRKCGDGMLDHFEAYASATALEKLYQRLRHSGLSRIRSSDPGRGQDDRHIGAHDIETLFAQHDPTAQRIVHQTQKSLAIGLANIIITLNPDCIVIGGGLSRFAALFNGLQRHVRARLSFTARCRICLTKLGDDAPLIGAALLTQTTVIPAKAGIQQRSWIPDHGRG